MLFAHGVDPCVWALHGDRNTHRGKGRERRAQALLSWLPLCLGLPALPPLSSPKLRTRYLDPRPWSSSSRASMTRAQISYDRGRLQTLSRSGSAYQVHGCPGDTIHSCCSPGKTCLGIGLAAHSSTPVPANVSLIISNQSVANMTEIWEYWLHTLSFHPTALACLARPSLQGGDCFFLSSRTVFSRSGVQPAAALPRYKYCRDPL